MATLDDLGTALIRADAAGDTAGAQALAAHIKWLKDPAGGNYQPPNNPVADMPTIDPTKDFGGLPFSPFGYDTGLTMPEGLSQRYAGVGQGMTNLARGIGQRLGLVDQSDIADARKLDAPLDATANGKIGNFLGTAAGSAPLAFIPGANTMAGAGAIGAAAGFLSPHASDKEGLQNTAVGGLAGLVPLAAWRGGQLASGVVGAVTDTMTAAGRARIAGQTYQAFAGGPQAAAEAAANMNKATSAVPNLQNTAGQVSGNAGIARLEATMRQNPEMTQMFYQRDQSNQNALLDSLNKIKGDPGQRDFYDASRSAAADDLYSKARASYDPTAVTPELQSQIDALQTRPSIIQATKDAQRIAAESNRAPSPQGSLAGMEDVGHALDDQIGSLQASGKTKEAAGVLQTKNQLLGLMDNLSPDFKEARSTFAEMSKPINQMDIGDSLYNKLVPALGDYGGNTRLSANSFAQALRNGDATAAKATGFRGSTLENTLTPDQNNSLTGVATELAKRANAQEMGAIPGSQTVQRLVSQNVLRNILGPLGLPQSASESILLKSLMRPVQWAGQLAEPDILNQISQGVLNPKQMSATILSMQKQGYNPNQISKVLEPYLAPLGRSAVSLGNATKQ